MQICIKRTKDKESYRTKIICYKKVYRLKLKNKINVIITY